MTFTPTGVTGIPDSVTWDFGDAGYANGSGMKLHTYTIPGSFTVEMKVWYTVSADSFVTKGAYVNVDCTQPVLSCTGDELTCDSSLATAEVAFTFALSKDPFPLSFIWAPGPVSGQGTPFAQYDAPGIKRVIVTILATGCSDTCEATITQNITKPELTCTGDELTCDSTYATASVSIGTEEAKSPQPTPYSYVWTPGPASGQGTPFARYDTPGIKKVVVTIMATGCKDSCGATITQNTAAPSANAGSDEVLTCTVTQINLSGSSSTPGATFSWAASNGGHIVSGKFKATPLVDQPGTYTLTVTDPANGCTATDVAQVTLNLTAPNANAGPDQILTCILTQINLSGSSSTPGATFAWLGSNGGHIVSGATTATPLVDEEGTYTLTVTDPANGCAATDMALVTKDCPCVPAPADMIAWWPLDETSGTTVVDIVGGFNGVALPGPIGPYGGSGPVTSSLWPLPTFPTGMVGNSLFFYGDRRVEVPSSTALEPGTGDFTIDAWVIYSAAGNGQLLTIAQKWDPSMLAGWRFVIRDYSLTQGGVSFRRPGSGYIEEVITPNTWHHVAARLSSAGGPRTVKVYVDAASSGANGAPVNIASTAPLLIGGDGVSAGEIAVDEVEIFNRGLDLTEIQAVYAAGSAGKCQCVAPNQGDIDGSGFIDVQDVLKVIQIAFVNGTDIQDPLCPTTRGDVNNSGFVDVTDVLYIIKTAFTNGPPPVNPCGP